MPIRPTCLATGPGDAIWLGGDGGGARIVDQVVVRSWELPGLSALATTDAAERAYAIAGDELFELADGVHQRTGGLPAIADFAVDPARALLLAARSDRATVEQISFTGAATELCELPEPAAAVCLSPDRRRLYAACGATIVGIELASHRLEPLLTIAGAKLSALALTPAGMVCTDAGGRLLGVNLRHRRSTELWRDPGVHPTAVAFDRPGRRYVMAVAMAHELLAVSADGSRAYPCHLRYPSAPAPGGSQ